MPKRNPSFGDSRPVLAGFIDPTYVGKILKENAVPSQAVSWFLELNGNIVRALPPDWLETIIVPKTLTQEMKERLSEAVHSYYFERLALLSSIKAQDVKSRLARIETSARSLLEAVEVDGHASVLVWEALESIEGSTLKRDDFYPALTMLINRAHQAIQIDGLSLKIGTAPEPEWTWVKFVDAIINIYRAAGSDVTITKRGGTAAKPSEFSQFAWSIVSILPKEVREHASDEWTLSEALASARQKIKQGFLNGRTVVKKPE